MGVPNMYSTKSGMRIKHSELISVIGGSVAYAVNTIDINPAISASFPWLSGVAVNFEAFKIHALQLRYVPRCATTTVGTIMMSTDYNSGDPTATAGPATETALMASPGAADGPAWTTIVSSLDPRRFNFQRYFTRGVAVQSNELYDPAFMYVGTVAFINTAVVGRLFVDYDIELMTPALPTTADVKPTNTSTFTLRGLQNIAVPNAAEVFLTPIFNPLGISYDPILGYLRFKPGAYKVTVCQRVAMATSLLGGKSRLQVLKNGAGFPVSDENNWASQDIDVTTLGGVTATVIYFIELCGVLVVTDPAAFYQFYFTAIGATPGNQTLNVEGATYMFENA